MNSEELVVVDERTDSGSENSAFEEYEEFEEVSASSDGRHDETELSATFGEMRGKLAALRARMDAPPPPPRHDSEGSLSPAAAEDDVPARAVPPVAADALASPPVPAEDDHVTALAAAKALPREYAVKAPGALVRAGLAMASARTRQLAPGDVITVEEVAVAPEGVPRARLSAPVEGWLSCKCVQGGEALAVIALRPPTPPTTPTSPDDEFVIVEERTDSGTDGGSPYEEFEEFEEVSASSTDDEAVPPPAEPVVAPPSPRTALDVAWSPPKPRKGRASEASEYSCAYELDLDRLAESDLTAPTLPPTPLRRSDPLDSARRRPPSTPAETVALPTSGPFGSAQRSPPSSTAGPPAHLDPLGVARSSRAGTRGPPDYAQRSSRRSP